MGRSPSRASWTTNPKPWPTRSIRFPPPSSAAASLDRTQGAAEAILQRSDKARDAYVAALTEYEKPLADIRALAISVGSAL